MSHQSIISGYILEAGANHEKNMEAVGSFQFDEIYPFTNIFWGGSPASFGDSVIGFTGIYKEIEPDWNEWLWKFSQFLSHLEASRAVVHLDGILGDFEWRLQPASWHNMLSENRTIRQLPDTFKGEQWGIYKAPPNDFSLTPPWNEDWNQLVPRWNLDKSAFL